ncbi:hypothetical protein LCGC14_1736250 [marine sediment metagenome]|uniref:Uncharacterized protein n=1 Tax=marine sediment metagenome TaxID=412755 RepID=A0A0F9H813_9ZZZZ
MKIKDFASINVNKANNQVSLNLKSKKLKKLGMTPEQLMEVILLKPKKIKIEGGNNKN